MFLVMSLSQKVFCVGGGDLISLSISMAGSSFDLECCLERILLSSLPAFSYSSSDSSSTKVLLWSSVLSSASFAYFLRRTLRKSLAFRSPNFELLMSYYNIVTMADYEMGMESTIIFYSGFRSGYQSASQHFCWGST
jgi:hypothetical protein